MAQGSALGGDGEARTPDLLHAMQALSQLSYVPWGATWYRALAIRWPLRPASAGTSASASGWPGLQSHRNARDDYDRRERNGRAAWRVQTTRPWASDGMRYVQWRLPPRRTRASRWLATVGSRPWERAGEGPRPTSRVNRRWCAPGSAWSTASRRWSRRSPACARTTRSCANRSATPSRCLTALRRWSATRDRGAVGGRSRGRLPRPRRRGGGVPAAARGRDGRSRPMAPPRGGGRAPDEIACAITGAGVEVSGRAVRFLAAGAGAETFRGDDGQRRYRL